MTSQDDPFNPSNHPKNKQKVSKTYGSIRSRLRPKQSRPIDQISLNSKLEEEDENFKQIKNSNPSDARNQILTSLIDPMQGPSKPTTVPIKPFLRSRVNQKPTNLLLDRSNAQKPTRRKEIQDLKQIEEPKNLKQPRSKKIKVHEDQEPRMDSSFFLEHSIDPLLEKPNHYPMQQGMDEEITLRLNENEHELALRSIPAIPNRRRLRSNDPQIENDLVKKRIRVATGSGSQEIKNPTEVKKKKKVEKKDDIKIKGKGSSIIKNKKEKVKIGIESPVLVSGEKFVPLDDDEYSDDPLRI
ncbi:uncharacterized protein MELLADRAFT_109924 [Melampsora larici-populina 98AG31]|uniref:Uncharacterized protein n=1 Tax=Melampsora larici-populina (strain 98AG31 / pathotype 3-4-7) TaxID=747676 RepID=F4RY32_MELLP|nr:uncharacterized protein MELLADRAFT_109924 [Melampsora larici-populina 98AG31]EGG02712.1 hypothetical protein MELLADRAFT_109924 [Melampsora larici-populina 98AG31]